MKDHDRNNWQTYARLLAYVKPYRLMLTIGLIAAFVCGGSIVGVLGSIPDAVTPLSRGGEARQKTETKETGLMKKLNPARKMAEWFGINLDKRAKVDVRTMAFLTIALALMLALKTSAQIANRFCMRWVGVHVVRDLRNQLFRHLEGQSLAFYSGNDVGKLMSRVNNDTGAIEGAVSATIADLTRAPIQVFVVAAYLVIFSIEKQFYALWVFVFILLPVVMIPIAHLSRRIRKHMQSSLRRIALVNSRMHEVFTGIRIVKAFRMEEEEAQRFEEQNDSYARRVLRALKAALSITAVLETMNVMMAAMVAVYCYWRGLSIADLVQLGMAGMLIYEPSKRLAKVNTQIQRSLAAADRIFALLDTKMTIDEAPNPTKVDNLKECLKFEHVGFTYDGKQDVLHDISFEIPKGKVVAFVGAAGCGKSTIANILGRFYDPTTGKVTIDGIDIRDIELASLRALIGVVTQDTILFNDTIAHNIAYGDQSVDMDRVVEAAKRASAHEFITEKPDGYETIVGEKGFMLSGGQKQRIAIARALYRDPQILILDEATSALDSVTEQQIQTAINELMKNRTVFAIAHRLSTIRHAHQIFVLEEGRIVEQGTHDELLEVEGKYLEMIDIQEGNVGEDVTAGDDAAQEA